MGKDDIFYLKVTLLILSTVGVYHGAFAAFFLLNLGSWKAYLVFVGVHVVVTLIFFAAGDLITAFTAGARKSKEFMESEHYLKDLYSEVVAYAKNNAAGRVLYFTPALYIADSVDFNAFALHSGVVMNKGIMTALPQEQQKGIIAHELGHITSNYPYLLTFLRGSMIIGSFFLFLYDFGKKLTGVKVKSKDIDISFNAGGVFSVILDFLILLPAIYFKIVSAPCFRAFEQRADEYAIKLGYGDELKGALKMSYQFELMRRSTFLDRLMATHPLTARRIAFIEKYEITEEKAAPSIIPRAINTSYRGLSITTSCAAILYFVLFFSLDLGWGNVLEFYWNSRDLLWLGRGLIERFSITPLSMFLTYFTIPLIISNVTCLIWWSDEKYFINKYKKRTFEILTTATTVATAAFFPLSYISPFYLYAIYSGRVSNGFSFLSVVTQIATLGLCLITLIIGAVRRSLRY